MTTYQYTKLEKSIEDGNFEYVTNLDDYKAVAHILNVLANEKLKQPELIGIFSKITRLMKNTIDRLSKITKGDNAIDVTKLKTLVTDGSFKKIILVRNEEYNSFASYPSGFEEDEKIQKKDAYTVFYNVGQLETSGSVSVVPSNANVFLSSMLYSYSLLFAKKFYERQNLDVFINIAKLIYTIILTSFGKKSGLLVGARQEKEYLFFLTSAFIFSVYARMDINNSDKLSSFLKSASSQTGSSYIREFFNKISNANLIKPSDPFDTQNYNDMGKYAKLCKNLELLEVSENDMKVQIFRMLGLYGILSFENYARFVAYMIATYIPNSYFSSTLKVYNKSSYQYLAEYYVKELFNVGV